MAARWRAPEDAVLAHLYGQGASLREIAELLGRSPDAVVSRRVLLGIPSRRKVRDWSPGHDALIRASASAGLSSAAVARQLGVPDAAIRQRRSALLGRQVAAPRYTAAEDQAIRACWASAGDLHALALALNRPADGIRLRAGVLGLRRPSPRSRWTAIEDRALRASYAQGLSCRAIQRWVLPARTPETIAARARKLGLTNYARRWTERDDRRLRALAQAGAPLEGVALALTRTPEGIRQRARKLNIDVPAPVGHPRTGRRWTPAEDALLRDHPSAHPSALVQALGRSDRAVRARIATLGLRAGRARSPHHALVKAAAFSPAEDRLLLRELALVASARRLLAVSKRLQRSPGELKRRVAGGQGQPLASRVVTRRTQPPHARRPDGA